jgi:hypothetical protein
MSEERIEDYIRLKLEEKFNEHLWSTDSPLVDAVILSDSINWDHVPPLDNDFEFENITSEEDLLNDKIRYSVTWTLPNERRLRGINGSPERGGQET